MTRHDVKKFKITKIFRPVPAFSTPIASGSMEIFQALPDDYSPRLACMWLGDRSAERPGSDGTFSER